METKFSKLRRLAQEGLCYATQVVQSVKESATPAVEELCVKVQEQSQVFVTDVAVITQQVEDWSKSTMSKMSESCAEIIALATQKLITLLYKIDFNATIDKLQEYQKTSGKDVQPLIDFLNDLKEIKLYDENK